MCLLGHRKALRQPNGWRLEVAPSFQNLTIVRLLKRPHLQRRILRWRSVWRAGGGSQQRAAARSAAGSRGADTAGGASQPAVAGGRR